MNKRRYFHTFDALRFIAFFTVFLTHAPVKKVPFLHYFSRSGGIGVQFFFVLSGFLISYILLHSKQQKGSFDLKNFFIRRTLRIWPLFYAMIAVAFLTPYLLDWIGLSYSNEGYEPNWLASCLFLENYMMMTTHEMPNVSPLVVMWSLCVEEHFYILWGLLFYFIPIKGIPLLIISAIIVANISRIIYFNVGLDFADLFTNLDYFAFGAIPAYCLIKKESVIDWIGQLSAGTKYVVAVFTFLAVFSSAYYDFTFKLLIEPFILGGLFMAIIFFTLPTQNRLYINDNNLMSKAGIYTYGLYLYHTIIINLLNQLSNRFQLDLDHTFTALAVSVLALLLTIGISVLSYYLFENQFLKLKKHFKN